jgi:hypothetical protein
MSDPLQICFDTLLTNTSTIKSLNYSQLKEYRESWDMFRSVELYNSNVSTQRAGGNTSLSYWKFPTYDDKALYSQGQSMYAYYLGFTSTVQKN